FLYTLVYYSSEFFCFYAKNLGDLEIVDQISLVKTMQLSVKAININPLSVAANGNAMSSLFN
ncbi:hypothetical protein C8Q75DRAFT_723023, partial [Abortiporus biennis]